MKRIRWGIVGLGNIAHKFASDLKLVEGCELTAVASSDGSRAQLFARKFGAEQVYDSYVSFFEQAIVDVVYIASLHPFHLELSLAAMESGKAVLCEKPLALNSSQVEKLIAKSQSNEVFLMEALWTRFNPTFEQMLLWIDQNALGKLRYIQASFSFNGLDRDKESRLFNLKKGGGSLLDIGIYPLFLAYQVLGMPNDIKASVQLSTTGADEQLAFILTYDHAIAVLYSSFAHDVDMNATIAGERGEIYMDSRWHETPNIQLVQGDQKEIKSFEFNGKGYSYEIHEVNECLRLGKIQSPKWNHQSSKDLTSLMDSIRKQVGIRYPQE